MLNQGRYKLVVLKLPKNYDRKYVIKQMQSKQLYIYDFTYRNVFYLFVSTSHINKQAVDDLIYKKIKANDGDETDVIMSHNIKQFEQIQQKYFNTTRNAYQMQDSFASMFNAIIKTGFFSVKITSKNLQPHELKKLLGTVAAFTWFNHIQCRLIFDYPQMREQADKLIESMPEYVRKASGQENSIFTQMSTEHDEHLLINLNVGSLNEKAVFSVLFTQRVFRPEYVKHERALDWLSEIVGSESSFTAYIIRQISTFKPQTEQAP